MLYPIIPDLASTYHDAVVPGLWGIYFVREMLSPTVWRKVRWDRQLQEPVCTCPQGRRCAHIRHLLAAIEGCLGLN
jgi:hypothetical protein